MDIQPIKNEKDYDRVLAEIERLWGMSEEGTEAGDKLDILLVLAQQVEDYEEKHHQISPPSPIEAIKFRMEQMNLTRKDLEPYIGNRGRVSEILNQRRELSLNMIRNLHSNLSIPLESLQAGDGRWAAFDFAFQPFRFPALQDIHEVIPAIIVSVLICLLVSLITGSRRPEQGHVDRLFTQNWTSAESLSSLSPDRSKLWNFDASL